MCVNDTYSVKRRDFARLTIDILWVRELLEGGGLTKKRLFYSPVPFVHTM